MSLDRLKISRTSGKQAGELRPERRRVRGKTKDFDRIYWVRDKVPGQPVSKRNAPLAKEVAKQPTSPKVEAAKAGAYTPAKLPKSLASPPPKLRMAEEKLEKVEGFDGWDPESAEGYVLKNANRIKELGRQVRMQLGAGQLGEGIGKVTTDSNISTMQGYFDGEKAGELNLSALVVAGLHEASDGSDQQDARYSSKILLHEMFHAASKFEVARLPDDERAIEEAATEILAQHYLPEFAKAAGFNGVAQYVREPFFKPGKLDVMTGMPFFMGKDRGVAYFTEVGRFALLASKLSGVGVEDGDALERASVNLALAVKRVPVGKRVTWLADQIQVLPALVSSWAQGSVSTGHLTSRGKPKKAPRTKS